MSLCQVHSHPSPSRYLHVSVSPLPLPHYLRASSNVALRHPHTLNHTSFILCLLVLGPTLPPWQSLKESFEPQEQDAIFTLANPPLQDSCIKGERHQISCVGPGSFSFQLWCQAEGSRRTWTRLTGGFSCTQDGDERRKKKQGFVWCGWMSSFSKIYFFHSSSFDRAALLFLF